MEVNAGLAILAGMAAFLSPCVFSIIPPFVAMLGGLALGSQVRISSLKVHLWNGFVYGLFFISGFSLVFIYPRVVVPDLGGLVYSYRDWLSKLGGVMVALLGLVMTGILHIPFLRSETIYRPRTTLISRILVAGMAGAFFSAGWSPCVGPVLGAILTLGMNGGNIVRTVQLLLLFCAGLAIPFLLIAIGIGWITNYLSRFTQTVLVIEKSLGVLLIVLGGMLSLGTFEQLARFGYFVDLGL